MIEGFQRVAILGAGQMGGGIAQVAAQSGYAVLLADADQSRAEAGRDRILAGMSKLVEKGKIAAELRDKVAQQITCALGPSAFGSADIVIEAATENIELKKRLFRELDNAATQAKILATNTSSISITMLAAETRQPDRVVGMHFMNPVPVMKLVELIRGLQTSEMAYASTRALAEDMGKTVITSGDCPGFLVNRVLIPLLNEACFALQEGVGTAVDIDTGAKLGLNHPMGPLELADLIGLDTVLAIADVLHRELGDDKYRAANILRMHVAAGWMGRKSGRGFYTYGGGR